MANLDLQRAHTTSVPPSSGPTGPKPWVPWPERSHWSGQDGSGIYFACCPGGASGSEALFEWRGRLGLSLDLVSPLLIQPPLLLSPYTPRPIAWSTWRWLSKGGRLGLSSGAATFSLPHPPSRRIRTSAGTTDSDVRLGSSPTMHPIWSVDQYLQDKFPSLVKIGHNFI